MPIGPGRLDQRTPRVAVARLGDRTLAPVLTGGVLPRDQTQVPHELSGRAEAGEITQFRNERHGMHKLDPAHRLQRRHHRGEAPGEDLGLDRPGEPLDAPGGHRDGIDILLEHDLLRGLGQLQLREPAPVRSRPGGLAYIADVVPEQQRLQLLAHAPLRDHRIVAPAYQIPDRLVPDIGHVDRFQLPRARQARQPLAVAPVGLHMIARALGHQRGGDHHAALPQRRELAVDPEPARPRLVHEHPLPALGLLLPHHLPQRPPVPADLPQAAHLTARLGERHVDRLLVHVHPHKTLARLFHGPSPFSVFAPPCQTCGSARPSRNPRYRGGGPPPLERKPFCLGGRTMDLAQRIRRALATTAREFNRALTCFDPAPGRVNTYPERMVSYYYIHALSRALASARVLLEIPVKGKSKRGWDNHIDALIFSDRELVLAEFKVAWAPSH